MDDSSLSSPDLVDPSPGAVEALLVGVELRDSLSAADVVDSGLDTLAVVDPGKETPVAMLVGVACSDASGPGILFGEELVACSDCDDDSCPDVLEMGDPG